MKRFVLWMLTLALLLSPLMSLCGLAQEIAVVNNPNPADRLHLRTRASEKADSLGKYYNGVNVEILEYTDANWVKARVAGVTGYMMRKYLAFGAAASRVQSAIPATRTVSAYINREPILLYPSAKVDNNNYVIGLTTDTAVEVLGVVGDNWLHVRSGSYTGYILTKYIVSGASFSGATGTNAVVSNPDPADRLNLRQSPDASAKSLGKFRNGTVVEVLEIVSDSWARVRVAGETGYMMRKFLSMGGAASGAGSDIAVVNNPNPKDRLHLRVSAKQSSESYGKYYNGVQVEILDYTNTEWVKVRVGGAVGYMMRKYLAFGSATNRVVAAIPLMHVVNTDDNQPMTLYNSVTINSGKMAATVPSGATVEVLAVVGTELLHVRYGNITGYADPYYLYPVNGNAEFATVRSGERRMYYAAKVDNKNYSVIASGASVRVLIKGDSWSYIQLENVWGYMKNSDLKF